MEQRAVCILGMHRSGTSALSRVVNLLGAYIGEESDLVPKSRFNPEGYWEHKSIIDLHDRILNHFNTSWHMARPLPEKWHLRAEMKPFRVELVDIIKKKFEGQKLWMWKDPRTSILLEIWKDALMELGIHLSCVIAIRNPLEVVGSLEKRGDPLSRDKTYGIWLNYNLCILRSTRSVQRSIVFFDDFMNDCEKELKRCSVEMALPWPEDDEKKAQIRQFVRPDLRHNRTSIDDLRNSDAPSSVIRFWELLEHVLKNSNNDLLDPEIERLYSELYSYARFFDEDSIKSYKLARSLDEHKARLEELKTKLAACCHDRSDRDERIRFLERQLNTAYWKKCWEKYLGWIR